MELEERARVRTELERLTKVRPSLTEVGADTPGQRMSDNDPAWLLGQTFSPCEALVWHEVHNRQFCVLPFFENGDRSGRQHYCMYGRARSDGERQQDTWQRRADASRLSRRGQILVVTCQVSFS